ncbi:heme exporter protein CcmD [Leisingera sp. M527]|uniref:heme exporter protein CcmD n=1 Tax=Leisingera TaxID=191028 RepID=UPI00040B0BF6|nr:MULTISPECIES: heme exporter protein CcmD [Leisingera]MBQ4826865.1 heme exporter protein CcmD [Leisingera sp. HS039]MCF6431312.1 heme exporter protein CcmD [Leisingera sp. MMG026]QBR36543.1 heme exporter protein CcmD [Leisingera sp. NJS201]UWQ30364.1 heme exporter protein CcmD [Leisingera sp. M523]UWQ34456.1 heme exporter protein CcmD [Leisingera sp. M527]
MPDLGKYADTVLSAYGASLLLLLALVVLTILRGRKVRREMETLETRMKRNG